MGDVNTCKTCKHWEAAGASISGDDDGYRPCYHVWFCWERTEDKERTDLVQAGGFEGYGDYLATGPDFGCIHHEERT